MFGPALRGDRISLEPPRREDLSLHRAWHADLEVFPYLAPLHGPSTPAQMEHDYEELATYERMIAWSFARERADYRRRLHRRHRLDEPAGRNDADAG